MPESVRHKVTPLPESGSATSAYQTALALTYKALRAYTFYPEGHPLREKVLAGAFQAMAQATREGMLAVVVHRNGFSLADKRSVLEASPMTVPLAQELFAREIQRLFVLPELTPAEFTGFLSLLALDPPKILAAGGLTAMLQQHGIQNIALNEIDITAVFTKKAEPEPEEPAPQVSSDDQGPCQDQSEASSLLDQLSKMSAEELVALMSREQDNNQYRLLSRLLLAKGLPLKQEKDFDRLFGVLNAMVEQSSQPSRSAAIREQALSVLQQLGLGEMTEHLLDHLEDAEFKKKEAVFLILKTLGVEVVETVVRRLIAVGLKASRKTLMTALLRIGPPAEPALIGLLKDGRWQVVLAAVAILAELGSRDAVRGITAAAYHSDGRVRMEAIRALAGIGGMEASAVLIELLRDPNHGIAAHAITWIGKSRNQRALQPLLQLVLKRDLRGRTRELKKEALQAIGQLGDRRALEQLCRLVQKRYWIAPSRWNELKLLAVEAISNLGGESARSFLSRVSAQGGDLGRASAAALESMAKRNPEHHE